MNKLPNLERAIGLGLCLALFFVVGASLVSACGDGGTSASGSGGSASSGTGGEGGAGQSSSGGFVDDAGSKECPAVPNTNEMIAVPGANGVAYCIDKTEVSNADYVAWLQTGPELSAQPAFCGSNLSFEPSTGIPLQNSLPVVSVDWCDAYTYCKTVGKRLCGRITGGPTPYYSHDDATRSQWHNACSHAGTLPYPYGQAYDANACNLKDAAYGAPLPVGTLASCEGGFAGLFDMSGNVWEWEDACIPDEAGIDICRRRGGSFSASAQNGDCDVASSRPRDTTEANTGFRCCAD